MPLLNANYDINSGNASRIKKYTPEQQEMISRLPDDGHMMDAIRDLEQQYPWELHTTVCTGIMALEEGQGRVRVTARFRDEFED